MNEKDASIFLEHILESIIDTESFSKNISKEDLSKNKEKLNAIVRSIEIIGEAAKNISNSFKEKHMQIPWRKITGTRDVIIRHYFGVDLDMVWKIVKEDLSLLKKQILEIKEKMIAKT